jgi:hypothetical protein
MKNGKRLTSKRGTPPKHGGNPSHPLFPHRYTGYILGCRCAICTEANTEKQRTYVAVVNTPGSDFAVKQAAMKAAWKNTPKGRKSHKAAHVSHKAKLRTWIRHTRDEAEIALIARIYASCPAGYHVDHIIPITKGGWHKADNLQYLPAAVNLRKMTKLDYDVSDHVIRWQDVLGSPFNDYPHSGVGSSEPKHTGSDATAADRDIVSSGGKPSAAALSGGVSLANWREDQAVLGLILQPPHGVSHE